MSVVRQGFEQRTVTSAAAEPTPRPRSLSPLERMRKESLNDVEGGGDDGDDSTDDDAADDVELVDEVDERCDNDGDSGAAECASDNDVLRAADNDAPADADDAKLLGNDCLRVTGVA